MFWSYLLMGGDLGNESYIDLLIVSTALSPPIFLLIGRNDFYTKFQVRLKKCVDACDFSRISERNRVGFQTRSSQLFYCTFVLHMRCCIRVRASDFRVLIRSGSRDTTLGLSIRL